MAMDDVDQEKWQEAMKNEMESMYSNSVWELIDLYHKVLTLLVVNGSITEREDLMEK